MKGSGKVQLNLRLTCFSVYKQLKSVSCVAEALLGIKDLISRHPAELALHAVSILEKLSPRITDGDKAVRQAFILLIRSTIFPNLPQVRYDHLFLEVSPKLRFLSAHS